MDEEIELEENRLANKTIAVTQANKTWLLSLRLHDRETANDIVTRIKNKIIKENTIIVA